MKVEAILSYLGAQNPLCISNAWRRAKFRNSGCESVRILISEGPMVMQIRPNGTDRSFQGHVSGPGPHPQMEKLESLTLVKLGSRCYSQVARPSVDAEMHAGKRSLIPANPLTGQNRVPAAARKGPPRISGRSVPTRKASTHSAKGNNLPRSRNQSSGASPQFHSAQLGSLPVNQPAQSPALLS